MTTATPFTRTTALRWCRSHKGEHRDSTTGELDYTGLAEACAEAFGVNGVGLALMMIVFLNTGGLTGIESHQHVYTLREPYDVVGLIFPWNGPVFNFCAKLAPSLAAG